MGYFKEQYSGRRSKEFIEGVIAGLEAYSFQGIDGKQYVGNHVTPLKMAIELAIRDLAEVPGEIEIPGWMGI